MTIRDAQGRISLDNDGICAPFCIAALNYYRESGEHIVRTDQRVNGNFLTEFKEGFLDEFHSVYAEIEYRQGQEIADFGTTDKVLKQMLKNMNLTRLVTKGSGLTLREIVEQNPKVSFIARTREHVAVVLAGGIYDTNGGATMDKRPTTVYY